MYFRTRLFPRYLIAIVFRLRVLAATCLLSVLLAACAISPPPPLLPHQMCNFVQYPIEIALPNAALLGSEPSRAVSPLAQQVRTALSSNSDQSSAVLALSGGSQHGAFGAGFLEGWNEAPAERRLPQFGVVTGISTGAILATFAFIGDTRTAVRGYSITSESQLLTPIVHVRNGQPSRLSMLDVVRRGAVADLAPLRGVLREEISPSVLAAVAQGYSEHRRLYVGVVDVDSGQAVAFDMGEMATRYVAAAEPHSAGADPQSRDETPGQAALRDCYVSAIVASSSAPLAALPVFIDNRMYVDGGARFGMFTDDVIQGAQGHDKQSGTQTRIYVIANGDMETDPHCGKSDASLCETPGAPTGGAYGAHSDWSLLNLAQRSEQVLVNQVYRFSASRIIDQAKNQAFFARIGPASLAHPFTLNDPVLGSGRLTCAEWQARDRDTLHPIQFFPRYMRCLIDYGRQRGLAGDWDGHPAPADVAVPSAKP